VPQHILFGVSGGIAAYKAPDAIRQLKKQGYDVTVIITRNAEAFVSKITLAVVSENEVFTDEQFLSPQSYHLSLARSADAFVIFPATANTVAKCAHGISDNLLTTTFLSFEGPKAIFPAMHTEMYENKQTQENIHHLLQKGVQVIGPGVGDLACGDTGKGRLVDIQAVLTWLQIADNPVLSKIRGKSILITMGGTRESLDSVRCISNRSTGKLGNAISQLAYVFGACVSVITTIPLLDLGYEKITYVESVDDMRDALLEQFPDQKALIMAAAVSDFRPVFQETKIRRQDQLTLRLEATEDLLGLLSKREDQQVIGFCLADHHLEQVAKEKLNKKELHYIVANTSEAIGKNSRDIMILSRSGSEKTYQDLSLEETAYEILSCLND